MIPRFSCRFNSLLSSYKFILYFDYCSLTGVDSVFLQVTSLLYFRGFIMMSPLLKAILKVLYNESFVYILTIIHNNNVHASFCTCLDTLPAQQWIGNRNWHRVNMVEKYEK